MEDIKKGRLMDYATTWRFPFGKHMGRTIAEVPSDYLDWIRDLDWFPVKHPDAARAIDQELATRKRSHYEPPEI